MKLVATELAYVRSQGLYITEKCDGCGKLLNQPVRYTITGKPEVYCSAACRDFVFFGDRPGATKRVTPTRCAHCGSSLKGKKRDAIYCDDKCRKRARRLGTGDTTAEVGKSRTPAHSNQQVTDAKKAG